MKTFDPQELSVGRVQGLLQGIVVPRPIAFASTIDQSGNVNLSPFSFFNLFSSNPPIVVFSPARRGRDNTTKHTLENVLEVPEVTISIVNYAIVEQTSLASVEYGPDVNEFVKAGLTPIASQRVKPPRVGESPASLECRVNQVIPLGQEAGAGNLVVCEVLLLHIREDLFDEEGVKVLPHKLDAVARMGGDWYCRANGEALFEVPKPNQKIGIGVDVLPEQVRYSTVLTGNHLGRLGNLEAMPEPEKVAHFAYHPLMQDFAAKHPKSPSREDLHRFAGQLLEEGKTEEALLVLLQPGQVLD